MPAPLSLRIKERYMARRADGLSQQVAVDAVGISVRSAQRIDRGQPGPKDEGRLLNSEGRDELNRLRKENRELRREKDFCGWRRNTLRKSSCRRGVSADRAAGRVALGLLAVLQLGVGRSGFYA